MGNVSVGHFCDAATDIIQLAPAMKIRRYRLGGMQPLNTHGEQVAYHAQTLLFHEIDEIATI